MQLHFLKAADGAPLTKTFEKQTNGIIKKTSYPPHLFKVTSQAFDIHDVRTFYAALRAGAEQGFAVQKGELDAELIEESRASHTLTDKPTEWVLFDIDDMPGVESVEKFIEAVLPTPFHHTTYIVQYSSSHGIMAKGLSAHVFFMMKYPTYPDTLKNWLRTLNLQNTTLNQNLTLQRGNQSALRWPLDVTVAGNDKYVYIAPPVCVGFEDPLEGKRIQLVEKNFDRVEYAVPNTSRNEVRDLERAEIQRLRGQGGLPHLSLRTTQVGNLDVLVDADPIEVTEWWEGGGYIHMNVNGGNSGAYWVNPRRPKYIHSFKDEPLRVLKEVAPKFWDEIKELCTSAEMLVFHDELTDKFHAGHYDPIEDEYRGLVAIGRGNIRDWCEYHFRTEPPDPIPQHNLVFDPTRNYAVDRAANLVNMFQPTEYMQLQPDESAVIPPTIKKLIGHVVNNDEETTEWFINWLAHIFQTRTKSRVALVLHGTKGTGKGVLFNHVIKPLFGEHSCQSLQQRDVMNDRFNEYLQQSLMVMFDESESSNEIRDKLFHWITEPSIRLRIAYAGGRAIESHTNFILASNKPDAAPIEVGDRRFTVAPRQETPIVLSQEEIDELIPRELSQFARFLASLSVDTNVATRPLENEAKALMRNATRDTVGVFIEALMAGDIIYFLTILENSGQGDRTVESETAIKRWAASVNSGVTSGVTMRELHAVYRLISQTGMAVAKFAVMLIKRGVPVPSNVTIGDKVCSGIEVEWKASATALQPFKDTLGGVRAPAVDNDVERAVLKMRE